MKRISHSLLLAAIPLLLFLSSVVRTSAQCGFDYQGSVVFYIPPAFAAQDGVGEIGDPARLYLGYRDGHIELYTLDFLGSIQQAGQATPGNQIPSEVKSIIDLSVPSPGTVVGLVLYYDDQGGTHYGILRSTDNGANWTLVKPPAVTAIGVIEDDNTRWDGNYWRAPLLETKWLEDGQHGWLWGRQSVLKTTDAGLTWSEIFSATADTSVRDMRDDAYDAIWGVAFESPQEGVIVHGSKISEQINYTTDGGANWNSGPSMNPKLVVGLDWTGSEYRLLRANPFNFGGDNLDILHGQTVQGPWSKFPKIPPISTNAELMTELLWPAHNIGFLVHRRGEIWMTEDGGANWTLTQDTLASYPPVPIGDGFGTDRGFPQRGYGQKSLFIRDEDGQNYIAQVLTDNCTGTLRDGVIYLWSIDQFAGVETGEKSGGTLALQTTPNPASTSLDLGFTLQGRADVRISLINTQGVRVRNLELGSFETGTHKRTISLEGVPGGYYQVEVKAGDQKESHAVIIVQ